MIQNICWISLLARELPINILLASKHDLEICSLKTEKDGVWLRASIEFKGSLKNIKAFNEDIRYEEKYLDAIDKILR